MKSLLEVAGERGSRLAGRVASCSSPDRSGRTVDRPRTGLQKLTARALEIHAPDEVAIHLAEIDKYLKRAEKNLAEIKRKIGKPAKVIDYAREQEHSDDYANALMLIQLAKMGREILFLKFYSKTRADVNRRNDLASNLPRIIRELWRNGKLRLLNKHCFEPNPRDDWRDKVGWAAVLEFISDKPVHIESSRVELASLTKAAMDGGGLFDFDPVMRHAVCPALYLPLPV